MTAIKSALSFKVALIALTSLSNSFNSPLLRASSNNAWAYRAAIPADIEAGSDTLTFPLFTPSPTNL